MAYTYAEFKEKLSDIVRDDANKLTPEEKDRHIQEAVRIYSRHRPREVVKDITGDGTYDYAITTHLTSWVKDFSVIKKIEYPADRREPEYVDQDEDWVLYEKEAGQYIHFLDDTPPATEKIRVTYTAPHILSDAQNTIPEIDQDAVCELAASLCSGALASVYAHAIDSTISADSVDHKSKSEQFASRARAQKKIYTDHVGIKEGDVPAASAVKGFDFDYPDGSPRLTHPKKYR